MGSQASGSGLELLGPDVRAAAGLPPRQSEVSTDMLAAASVGIGMHSHMERKMDGKATDMHSGLERKMDDEATDMHSGLERKMDDEATEMHSNLERKMDLGAADVHSDLERKMDDESKDVVGSFLPTFDASRYQSADRMSHGGNDGAERPSRQRISFGGSRTTKNSLASVMKNVKTPMVVTNSKAGIQVNKQNTEDRILRVLEKFDVDKNGTLDVEEVTALVDHLLEEERQSKMLKYGIIFLVTFTVVLLAATTGLTYAMVATLKDTEVKNSVFLVSKSGNIIQTASADFQVNNEGLLTNRYAADDLTSEVDPSLNSNVLRVSTYAGIAQGIHSEMEISELMDLNYLQLRSGDGRELAFRVTGCERKPFPQTLYGRVLFIYVTGGTIVLDGTNIQFEEEMTSIFAHAGFSASVSQGGSAAGSRRRLLDATPTARYNRIVNILPLPEVNTEQAGAWQILASSREEAANATALLAAYRVDNVAQTEYAAMWQDYKAAFGKAYPTMNEDLQAFRTWVLNMLVILQVNTDVNSTFWTSPSVYSDMEFAEFTRIVLNSAPPPNRTKILEDEGTRRRLTQRSLLQAEELKDYVNWVEEGAVTEVKDQGRCGSCWAFAGAAALESAILISNPDLDPATVDVSEEAFVACVNAKADPSFISIGCWGGDPIETLMFASSQKYFGVAEEVYNYTLANTENTPICNEVKLRDAKSGQKIKNSEPSDYVYPWDNEEALMRAVMRQPVAGYIMVDVTFMEYAGGVYSPKPENEGGCTAYTNHNVLIVGYNRAPDNGDPPYWIVKNQWGDKWGEKGYARIIMTGDGPGPCGLYTIAVFPSLEFSDITGKPKKVNGESSNSTEDVGNDASGDSGDDENGDSVDGHAVYEYSVYENSAGNDSGGSKKGKRGKKAARRRL